MALRPSPDRSPWPQATAARLPPPTARLQAHLGLCSSRLAGFLGQSPLNPGQGLVRLDMAHGWATQGPRGNPLAHLQILDMHPEIPGQAWSLDVNNSPGAGPFPRPGEVRMSVPGGALK